MALLSLPNIGQTGFIFHWDGNHLTASTATPADVLHERRAATDQYALRCTNPFNTVATTMRMSNQNDQFRK
jgi:hypothetical protein